MHYEYRKDNYLITTDPETFDLDVIHSFLTRSYWKPGVPKAHIKRSIDNSFCFGLFDRAQQIGFTRVVTDFTDFAYLCDVFVLPDYQGQALGQWLIRCVLDCSELQGLGSIVLLTQDAQSFYDKFGFQEHPNPDRVMILRQHRPWHDPALIIESNKNQA